MNRFSRRKLLEGLGASAALLPLLGARKGWATPVFPRRVITVVWPNGVIPQSFWPTGDEANFTIDGSQNSPLKPLIPHQKDIIVVGGTEVRNGIDTAGIAGHAALPFLLTGVKGVPGPQISDGIKFSAGGPSVDQHIANEIAKTTKLPFHSLVLRSLRYSGNDIYSSFRGPPIGGSTINAPTPEDDPVKLFSSLFSGGLVGTDTAMKIRAERKSVFDFVGRNLAALGQRVGTDDRMKIDAHITAVRDVERQLDATGGGMSACSKPAAPAGGKDYLKEPANPNVPEIHKLQVDMVVAAMACDMTRVANIMWSNSNNNAYTFFWLGDEFFMGARDADTGGFGGPYRHHHEISHNGYKSPDHTRRKNLVDQWFFSQFAYIIQKLGSVAEGDGTMLDNTVVLFANCMQEGGSHSVRDLPWVMAGRCGGYFKTGRYLRWVGGVDKQLVSQNLVLNALCEAMGVTTTGFSDTRYGAASPRLKG